MTGPRRSLSPSFEIEEVPGDLGLVAVTDVGLGNTAWVAGLDGTALIVDPERDPEPYLAAVEVLPGPPPKEVVAAETHLHADFLSGVRELAQNDGTALAPAGAKAQWAHRPVSAGEVIELGRWRLEALSTPGHTPEHQSYLLRDGTQPRAVFTGGSLLVGAVARTDLTDPGDTERLTRALWESIDRTLLRLPDDVFVLPTHGAGSFCSAAGGSSRWTTIGTERRQNPLLQLDEEEFVRAVLDSLGTYPPYFLRLRERNRLGPRLLGALPLLPEVSAEHAWRLQQEGAAVVDTRSVAAYAQGHIGGSLSNALRPQFASWLGWLVEDPALPLVFVTDPHTDHRELVRQCLNIGFEDLAGTISIESWQESGRELRRTPLVSGPDGASDRCVVDVRQEAEFASGHLPSAFHVELGRLERESGRLPKTPLVVMCGHGERAATAASVLEASGRHDVAIAVGGPAEWADRAGQKLER